MSLKDMPPILTEPNTLYLPTDYCQTGKKKIGKEFSLQLSASSTSVTSLH